MSTVAIVLVAVAAVFILLALGGYVAAARRAKSGERGLLRQIAQADQALAQAKAGDKGWDRALMEAAARAAIAARLGSVDVQSMQLVNVIDRPGTDADQAVFRVQTPDGEHRVTLGRTNGVWGPAESL
jgi:hypothetical protein